MSLVVKIKKQLDNFELTVDMQTGDEIVSVIGLSGSGKSMTLKCIAGIETPDSGFISLNGRVLYDSQNRINLSPQERKVGYLFQDYALFPTMTVQENISIVMRHRDIAQVNQWLERYGLTGLAGTYPDRLSGGQKQRVAMIRMLASEPECILLDEPFSALDEHIKRQMELELMDMLGDYHKPVVLVSHNREEVYRLASRICSMEMGKLSPLRGKKDFFENPQTLEQARLVGCINISHIYWKDEHYVHADAWDTDLYISDEKICKSGMKKSDIEYVGIFPEDISAIYIDSQKDDYMYDVAEYSKVNTLEIPVCGYEIAEGLSNWEINYKLKEDLIIEASLGKDKKLPDGNVQGIRITNIHLLKLKEKGFDNLSI